MKIEARNLLGCFCKKLELAYQEFNINRGRHLFLCHRLAYTKSKRETRRQVICPSQLGCAKI